MPNEAARRCAPAERLIRYDARCPAAFPPRGVKPNRGKNVAGPAGSEIRRDLQYPGCQRSIAAVMRQIAIRREPNRVRETHVLIAIAEKDGRPEY